VNHHPADYYPPNCGEYSPTRSNWTPRATSPNRHRSYQHHQEYSEEYDDRGGLAVPSLGETRSSGSERFSPHSHLTPRIKPMPPISRETPPRPPAHYRQRAFSPPISPSLHRSKSKEERILECSPIEEENNPTDHCEKEETEDKTEKVSLVPYPSISNSSESSIKLDTIPKIESPDAGGDAGPPQELQQRDSSEIDFKMEDLSEMRASPGLLLSVDEDGNVEAMPQGDDDKSEDLEHNDVEDIQMSPIAYDREDPISLMDLPENLLSLPISPCGPNDDPVMGCFRC
jgi:hypothetical protein